MLDWLHTWDVTSIADSPSINLSPLSSLCRLGMTPLTRLGTGCVFTRIMRSLLVYLIDFSILHFVESIIVAWILLILWEYKYDKYGLSFLFGFQVYDVFWSFSIAIVWYWCFTIVVKLVQLPMIVQVKL